MLRLLRWAYKLGVEQERERLQNLLDKSVQNQLTEYHKATEQLAPPAVLEQLTISQNFVQTILERYKNE